MSSDREKSAIDVIYELGDKIELLNKKIDILDTNLKLANNKISKLNKAINVIAEQKSFSNDAITSQPTERIVPSGKDGGLVLGKIKTFGRVATSSRKPIKDVMVKIYNESGDLIKTRKTDSDGYWDVRLPGGKYGVQYSHKKFKDINITIQLTDDMDSFEVK